jgi:hypothetical protein
MDLFDEVTSFTGGAHFGPMVTLQGNSLEVRPANEQILRTQWIRAHQDSTVKVSW